MQDETTLSLFILLANEGVGKQECLYVPGRIVN